MKTLVILILGTTIYLASGAAIDAVLPAADLLGFNFQALIWSTACLVLAVWLLAHFDLLE